MAPDRERLHERALVRRELAGGVQFSRRQGVSARSCRRRTSRRASGGFSQQFVKPRRHE
jgi:hypothetical protein